MKRIIFFILLLCISGCSTLNEALIATSNSYVYESQTKTTPLPSKYNSVYIAELNNDVYYQQSGQSRKYSPSNKRKFAFFTDVLRFFISNYEDLNSPSVYTVELSYNNPAISEIYVTVNNCMVVTLNQGERWDTVEDNIHAIINNYRFFLSSGCSSKPTVDVETNYRNIRCVNCYKFD